MGQVFWSRGRTMEGGAFPDYGAPFFYAIFVPVKPTHKPLQTVAQQRTQTNYIGGSQNNFCLGFAISG